MNRIVAIDGHNLALQRGTGVATYAKSLADNIREMGGKGWTLYGAPISQKQKPMLREISFFDYLGGAGRPRRQWWSRTAKDVSRYLRSPLGYSAIEIPQSGVVESRCFDSRLPRAARLFNVDDLFLMARDHFKQHRKFLKVRFDEKPDVMHWTYPLPIAVEGVPNIYTLHDLVPLRLPYTTLDNKRYYQRLIGGCIEYGDRICTVSEKSKEDILRLFDVPEEKVKNTYQAVDTFAFKGEKSDRDAEQEVSGIYGLEPYDYFLFFGAIEPKKNVGRLVEAYLSSGAASKLVIVGSRAWKSEEETKLLDALEKHNSAMSKNVRLFDYAPRAFLISLIRCAKAVVFPSLYEGFGLPVLEAMQLGVPTLCSTEGSLPEIAGNASLIVNPYDTAEIARALERLDTDAGLRAHLAELGLAQAGRFSAENYRNRLTELYDSVL
jgi:glycosyltransferase involved in cell wall biosynthesis